MSRTFRIACLLVLPAIMHAQTAGIPKNNEIKINAKNVPGFISAAHTPEQYKQLADYYHQQERMYRDKAVADKAEHNRRAAASVPALLKYPAAVNSAEYYFDIDTAKANAAATNARHYDELAASTAAAQSR